MQLHFLHGTETGTAELLCEDLVDALKDQFTCTAASMEDTDPSTLSADILYIMVASTYGSGDLPATAIAFSEKLDRDKTDLSHVRFAVFGVGDTLFDETYNQGSEKIQEQLKGLNATMVGERGLFDTSGGDLPEDVALPWLQNILENYEQ